MSHLPVTLEDLARYRNDREIVNQTAHQVIKDFVMFGYEINLPADLCFAYDDLFDQLSPVINELSVINISKLYSLLYAIDVNEKSIKRGINKMPEIPFYEVITHLILERELKKVITRRYFSRNS
jgi:hypothetical protein